MMVNPLPPHQPAALISGLLLARWCFARWCYWLLRQCKYSAQAIPPNFPQGKADLPWRLAPGLSLCQPGNRSEKATGGSSLPPRSDSGKQGKRIHGHG